MRFYAPIVIIAGFASMVACSGRDPVADQPNNLPAAPTDVDVLPPEESVATPTDELENGDDEDVNVSAAEDIGGPIPAAFQGRWGLTPGDCTSNRGDAKGLLVVSGDTLRFYEARAEPLGELKRTPNSVSGSFASTGEGTTWKKYEVLELRNNRLVRTQSDPMASYTYARCNS